MADETFEVGKKGFSIITNEIHVYGLKETIKANSSIFVPIFIFIVFFLLYLKNKCKEQVIIKKSITFVNNIK